MSAKTFEFVRTAAATAAAGAATDYVAPDLFSLPWAQLGLAALIAVAAGGFKTLMTIASEKPVTWRMAGVNLLLAAGASFLMYSILIAAQVSNQMAFGGWIFLSGLGGGGFLQLVYDRAIGPIVDAFKPKT